MTNPDEPFSNREAPRWSLDDITFTASQLNQEFPTTPKDKILAAVNSATPFVAPTEGKVKLMRRARDFLRLPG